MSLRPRPGESAQFGARPLSRTLQRRVESPLSVQLLRGHFQARDTVVVDVGEKGLTFRINNLFLFFSSAFKASTGKL